MILNRKTSTKLIEKNCEICGSPATHIAFIEEQHFFKFSQRLYFLCEKHAHIVSSNSMKDIEVIKPYLK